MSLAVKRYAESLAEVAKEEGCIDEVYSEFGSFYGNLKIDAEFNRLVTKDYLSTEEKTALINSVFKSGNPFFRGFLTMLAERNHLDEIEGIFLAFEKTVKNYKNILDVEVVTASPLDSDRKNHLIKALSDKYHKSVVLKERIDETLIGGIVLYIDDKMLDASLKTRFEGLREHLKKTELV